MKFCDLSPDPNSKKGSAITVKYRSALFAKTDTVVGSSDAATLKKKLEDLENTVTTLSSLELRKQKAMGMWNICDCFFGLHRHFP